MPAQSVSSLFVQQGQDGKLTPIDVTADKLTYADAERRARYTGKVFAKSAMGTIDALLHRHLSETGRAGD